MTTFLADTDFRSLMQNRINKVLVICSRYDFFMLEEDGRIDEIIFNEYVSLSLRYPPVFLHAETVKQAIDLINNDDIDLIIPMLSIREVDTFKLAKQLKKSYPKIPIVVLTHFSRDVSLRIEKEDLTGIDYIFSWLGNTDIFLAIIKLIEDEMNAPNDVLKNGVRAILLVEDSIRYISLYLPHLYKIILEQSKSFAGEALNAHNQMLRRRGRPKILLAKTYSEAHKLYCKYRKNILGIISDVSYKSGPTQRDTKAKSGLRLCELVKNEDPNIPFLLQSSDIKNATYAAQYDSGFLHKYSTDIFHELKEYILDHFGFGDFVFKNPETGEEITRATDLKTLHECLETIPDEVLKFHAENDDISKWLHARALFDIAADFKMKSFSEFGSAEEARKFIIEGIDTFRQIKARGIIAQFDKLKFDKYSHFSRIGNGSLGGKARGLAFMNSVLECSDLHERYPGFNISIPSTVVISTDVFDEFMEMNNIYKEEIIDKTDDEILKIFQKARLPESLLKDIWAIGHLFKNPIAIRSSSKLEDSHYQPFAGVYKTFMIPSNLDDDLMARMIESAIKSVYASVFYKNSRAYMLATTNVIDEEKMGIIIQEVCGTRHGDLFYPTISGVARSVNFYPIPPEKPNRGIVNMAFGLGKYIVDGNVSLRFSPDYPDKIIQLSTPKMALHGTQHDFIALDLGQEQFTASTNDSVNLLKLSFDEINDPKIHRYISSVFDYENQVIRDRFDSVGQKLITFAPILKYRKLPLAKLLCEILEMSENAFNNAVEIEFAIELDLQNNKVHNFSYLQVRPIISSTHYLQSEITKEQVEKAFVHSTKASGNGMYDEISDLLVVDFTDYDPKESGKIVKELEEINKEFVNEGKGYVLAGPGRWGSSDSKLGVPVQWSQISAARVIIEIANSTLHTEPSQGTHFFHNITNLGVGYMYVNACCKSVNWPMESLKESNYKYVKYYHFDKPLKINFNGIQQEGVIMVNDGSDED